MPRLRPSWAFLALATMFPASLLLAKKTGVVPGITPGVPPNLNVGFPGCGAFTCHSPSAPNSNFGLAIQAAAAVRPGAVPVTVQVSGGVNGTAGGFSLESSAGTFTAGTNTTVGTTSNGRAAVSHSSASSRTWSFQFQTGAHRGLVSLFASGNAADGSNTNRGDAWGWYGPDPTLPGTPYRMFVNDSAVVPFGESCGGSPVGPRSFRFLPLLGIAKNVAVGSTFRTEVYNVPPGTASVGILGFSNRQWGPLPLPFPLKPFGADGCFLRVSMDITQVALTAGSGKGGGSGKIGWAIPNIPGLRGVDVYFQAMTVDLGANAMNLSFSHGLRATIQ